MSYVESLLATGEEIVYTTKKHWIAPLFSTVTGTLLTLGRPRRDVRPGVLVRRVPR